MIKVGDYLEIQKKKRNVDVCNFFILRIMCLHTKRENKELCNFP